MSVVVLEQEAKSERRGPQPAEKVTLNRSGVKTLRNKSLYVAAEAATHKHFDFFRFFRSL
jgi:hypothetical protein